MTIARTHNNSGLTLTELLVGLAIVAMLFAILLPAVQRAREAARRLSCQNNLRRMGMGVRGFQSSHGRFPPGATAARGMSTGGCDPEEVEVEDNPGSCTDFQAWTADCLPFLEQALADDYDYTHPWSSLVNRPVVGTHLDIFVCPSAPSRERVDRRHVKGAAATDYGAILQVDRGVYTDLFGVADPGVSSRQGVLAEYESSSPEKISDGLSNTLMISECAGRAVSYVLGRPMSRAQFARYTEDEIVEVAGRYLVADGIGWADPDSGFSIEGAGEDGVETFGPRMINATNAGEAYSFHPGGANFVLADGSLRFLSSRIDPWVFVGLCTRGGREGGR